MKIQNIKTNEITEITNDNVIKNNKKYIQIKTGCGFALIPAQNFWTRFTKEIKETQKVTILSNRNRGLN